MKWGKRWTEDDFEEEQLREIGRTATKARKKDKYNRSRREDRTADGIVFDSKKEMRFYLALKSDPDILIFHRQPIFDFPGGVTYRADFQVIYKSGKIEYFDVKGMRTKDYIRNKKLAEAIYPVKIKEV